MQTRIWRAAASFALGTVGLGGLAAARHAWKLRDDRILNPNQEPYLDFAENERRAGKRQFAPWVTPNQNDLALAQRYFPEVPLLQTSQQSELQSDKAPVEVLSLAQANKQSKRYDDMPYTLSRITGYGLHEYLRAGQLPKYHMSQTEEPLFIAVGGSQAAMLAYQRAKEGKPVLYVKDLAADPGAENAHPLDAGAANQGGLAAPLEVPAFTSGQGPLSLLWDQMKAFVNPPRYDKEVLRPEFSEFNSNLAEWLRNPGQGVQVAWSRYRLAKQSAEAKKSWQNSEALEQVNDDLKILRQPREALLVARTKQAGLNFLSQQEALKQEGSDLRPISSEAAREKYGFYPRRVGDFLEKKKVFIFEPQALEKMVAGIKAQGGTVVTNWQLNRVLVDTHENRGGILEFRETTASGETHYHHRQFSQAHLALGSRPFSPNPYPLVRVSGISINALLMGVNLSGGPVYFGGALVPLTQARRVDVGDKTKNDLDITDLSVVRITARGPVGPAACGAKEPSYDGQQAVHLYENAQTTLPRDARLKILSVTGSSSMMGVDGKPVETHPLVKEGGKKLPVETVTLQMGTSNGWAQGSSVLFSPKASAKKAESQKKGQERMVDDWKKYSPWG